MINTPLITLLATASVKKTCSALSTSSKKRLQVPIQTVTLLLDVAYIDYAGEKEEVRKIFKKAFQSPANILSIVAYSMFKGFTLYGQSTGAMIGVSSSKEIIEDNRRHQPIYQPCDLVQHQPSGNENSG